MGKEIKIKLSKSLHRRRAFRFPAADAAKEWLIEEKYPKTEGKQSYGLFPHLILPASNTTVA